MQKKVIVTGSLAYDYVFDIPELFSKYILPEKIHNINFAVVTDGFKRTFGGTAGNQTYYLTKLGASPILYASAGNDFFDYNKFLKKNHIETKNIFIAKKLTTAAGFAITDPKDNQIWIYSKGAMAEARNLSINNIYSKIDNSLVIISPNDIVAMSKYIYECINKNIPFVFDPAFYIPNLNSKTLLIGVQKAEIIFGNDYEIAFLEKRIKKKLTSFLSPIQILVKTLGDQGSEIWHDKKLTKVRIYKSKVIDPTGAGDAYRAGFLYGYLQDLPMKTCGKMGAVVASFAVEIKGTINLFFSKTKFLKRLSSSF
jgi:adenosine kinase